MMRRNLTTLVYSLVFASVSYLHAQSPSSPPVTNTPNFLWARNSISQGTMNYDLNKGIAVDKDGNVYITGIFQSSTISFGQSILQSSGGSDVFLAKYDKAGSILWAKSFIGFNTDNIYDINLDPEGNILLTGSFSGSYIIFGTDTLSNIGNDGDDVFIAKIDPSGEALWARGAGGSSATCRGFSIVSDRYSNTYVTGIFFDPTFSLGSYSIPNSGCFGEQRGCEDIFIAKYDPEGNVIWANSLAGIGSDRANKLAIDPFGYIYLTGCSSSPQLEMGSISFEYPENQNFLAKMDEDGNLIWVRQTPFTTDIDTDERGNVYATGYYSDNFILGQDTLISVVNSNNTPTPQDVFLLKINSLGQVLWAKSAGGESNDYGSSLVVENESIYVAGSYSFHENHAISFGTITLESPAGAWDPVFVAKYDITGNILKAFSLPSGGSPTIGLNDSGDLYLSGSYEIDPFTIGSNKLTLTGVKNIFATKFTYDNVDVTDIQDQTDDTNQVTANDPSLGKDLIIYPNPFSKSTTIESDRPFINATIKVYNSFGQIVREIENIHGKSIEIYRNDIPSGIYIISLVEDNRLLGVKKLVITDL